MERQEHNKITEWLEGLQRESWQLELIVSGFTIFLLLQLVNVMPDLFPSFNKHTNFSTDIRVAIITFLVAIMYAAFTLLGSLLLHIFLRGFWIAVIGLRSVQQETDFDTFNYSPHFTNKLKQLVPSLDKLIIRIDNLASVVFAFAFLLAFMFLSLAWWVLILNTIGLFIQMFIDYLDNGFLKEALSWFFNFLWVFLFVSSIIYLIDTLTLGFFKKYQKIAKIYYPFYRLWGWVTLAGIYRSIYYSLANRFSKSTVGLLLFIFLFLIGLYPFHRITFYKYFPDYTSNAKMMSYSCYDNLRGDDGGIWTASIASDVVNAEYLPLFIRYSVKHNEVLDSLCTDYTPTKSSIFVSGIHKGFRDPYYAEEDADKLLTCLSRLYSVYVDDSLYTDLEFFFYSYPNHKTHGLRTMIYTGNLPEGKNTIRIARKKLNDNKKIDEEDWTEIPFWLESRE